MRFDQFYIIEGIASFRIQMFDEVWYTSILKIYSYIKQNLVSFEMLDLKHLEWSSIKRIFKVKIDDKYILRVYKYNNL